MNKLWKGYNSEAKSRCLYLRCVCVSSAQCQPAHLADWGALSSTLYHLIKALFLMEEESFQISLFKKNFFLMFIFLEKERERQSMSMGGAERERETESKAGSGLQADMGLELTHHKIMT